MPTVGRGAHAPRKLQPRETFARPSLLVDRVLPFSFEDLERGFCQVDRSALEVSDDNPASAARAPSRVVGRWVEGDAAVRAPDRNGRFRHDR
jgi:hypothetical protein